MTNRRTFVVGVGAYAAVKMAALAVTTGATIEDVLSSPALFLPGIGLDVISELVGAGLIAGTILLATRSSLYFLIAGLAQLALSLPMYLLRHALPLELNLVFGTSHQAGAWGWLIYWPKLEPSGEFLIYVILAVASCLIAGMVAQAAHNMAAKPRVEIPFQRAPRGSI